MQDNIEANGMEKLIKNNFKRIDSQATWFLYICILFSSLVLSRGYWGEGEFLSQLLICTLIAAITFTAYLHMKKMRLDLEMAQRIKQLEEELDTVKNKLPE